MNVFGERVTQTWPQLKPRILAFH